MPKARFTYRPYVVYSATKPPVPFDWHSHGYIGISTNDHATAARWRATVRRNGYGKIGEAADWRAMCNAHQTRARDKMLSREERAGRATRADRQRVEYLGKPAQSIEELQALIRQIQETQEETMPERAARLTVARLEARRRRGVAKALALGYDIDPNKKRHVRDNTQKETP